MCAKIINPHRYKKTTRAQVEKDKKQNKNKNSTTLKKSNDLKYKKEKLKKSKQIKKEKLSNSNVTYNATIRSNAIYIPKFFKIAMAVIVIVSIGFLSRKIVKFENMPILSVFSNKDKDVKLQKDYYLKIGISKLDTTDKYKTKNIILNELNTHTSKSLLKIEPNYQIKYLGASKVEKVSNKEYLLYLNKEYNISFNDIKKSAENISQNSESNIYYKNVKNIKEIQNNDEFITFVLHEEDPYFVYLLDFPIETETKTEYLNLDTSNDVVNLERNSSKSTVKNINLKNYEDTDNMVSDFRNNNLDVFFTSSSSVMQMIGKHEYNIKKYRDGENTFILGNKESRLFSLSEVRKALAYSINREEIVKEVNSMFSEIIDLPYIYSDIKYKYDIYGAENELLSSGWKKSNDGIYAKQIDGQNVKLELSLLLNEESEQKKQIAEMIMQMVKNVGIKININAVKEKEIESKLQNREYDIVLADVYTNNNPDISYLGEYISLNENIEAKMELIKQSTVENLPNNIINLQETLSLEVACIGILARNTNLVYQKDIAGFDEIKYMRVFDNIENIGKIEK